MITTIKKLCELLTPEIMTGRNYIEIDGIRIVVDDGAIEGWYNPGQYDDVPSEECEVGA